jgi:hypothetical protein
MKDTGGVPEEVNHRLDPPALGVAYESAWADWRDSGEAAFWEPATGAGIELAG